MLPFEDFVVKHYCFKKSTQYPFQPKFSSRKITSDELFPLGPTVDFFENSIQNSDADAVLFKKFFC